MSRTTVLYREADVFWEETGKHTKISQRGKGPDNHIKIAEITSGRSNFPAGTNNNLRRLRGIGDTKPQRGILDWRMSS